MDHHLDYFALRWRGLRKENGKQVPVEPTHPWHGVRDRVLAAFRRESVAQAQAMGLLDSGKRFEFRKPDPAQYVGFDGVVFPMSRRRQSSACDEHATGRGPTPIYGSKFTIASCRVLNQYGSRVILDMQHNGGPQSSDPDEGAATVAMAKRLSSSTRRGMKGIVVDSVIRGQAVTDLERNWITVVNYPHAASNPRARAGQRLAPDRKEKCYLRRVLIHTDANGTPCQHHLFFNGGVLVEGTWGHDGEATMLDVQVDGYEERGVTVRRQSFLVTIRCALAGDFKARIPLFHLDAPSSDPDLNYGEVARVFAPNSSQFLRLYGMRNDTESRHTSLKARARHLPSDVLGQELRLLGAAIASNAMAWQLHLQLAGEDNVFDDTA